jgi:hypothetical protein
MPGVGAALRCSQSFLSVSTACTEDTNCSPAGHPTSAELAEIEALVADADRLLSTGQKCGSTTWPRPSNMTFETLADRSGRFH